MVKLAEKNSMKASEKDLAKLDEVRHLGTGRLLLTAREDFKRRVAARMKAQDLGELPPAFVTLLPYIDTSGTRSTELAQAAGISKQAVAKSVTELEKRGLLMRTADPSDARALVVRLTDEGMRLLVASRQAVSEVEKEYEKLLGPQALKQLRDALLLLTSASRQISK